MTMEGTACRVMARSEPDSQLSRRALHVTRPHARCHPTGKGQSYLCCNEALSLGPRFVKDFLNRGLSVTDQELQERISLHKQEYGKQAAQFDQPEMQREVASRLLTEKTVNRLFEIATKK